MSFGFFLCTEIISIVHAIQSDELANIPDIGLQHVFHTVHLLYLVYGAFSQPLGVFYISLSTDLRAGSNLTFR